MIMIYVMSDLHGCFEEYKKGLDLIKFSSEDSLYILGDCMDRGNKPVELLKDIKSRKNIYPICGNHDIEALCFIRGLLYQEDSIHSHALMTDVDTWLGNGGTVTYHSFLELPEEECRELLQYIEELPVYYEIEVEGERYLLVHGGLEPFVKGKKIEAYSMKQMINSRIQYDKKYFEHRYTVTGHTQTPNQKIVRMNQHVAIDCGCAYGGNLGILCLDTMEEFYIKSDCVIGFVK